MDARILVVLLSNLRSNGNIFLYCAVCHSQQTNFYVTLTDHTCRISIWYEFPIDLPKYMVLILVNAYRPLVFDGLGIIDSNLMTFIKVRIYPFNDITYLYIFTRSFFFIYYLSKSDNDNDQLLFDVQKFEQIIDIATRDYSKYTIESITSSHCK